MNLSPIAFAGLLLAWTSPAPAQTAPADTARLYRHHLGLTASPQLDHFFTANRSLPVGLLYKRQTAPNKLWRFGLVMNQDYSRRDEFDPKLPYIYFKSNEEFINNNFGLSVSVGRELTYQFTPRWTGTVGTDVGVGFSQYKRGTKMQRAATGPPNLLILEDEMVVRQLYYQASVTPFVGLRYHIWPRLYVSAESAISATYLRSVFEAYGKTTALATGEILFGTGDFDGQTLTDQSFTLRYKLINQLTLHYVLK